MADLVWGLEFGENSFECWVAQETRETQQTQQTRKSSNFILKSKTNPSYPHKDTLNEIILLTS